MPPRLVTCIYCGASFDASRSEGDHVIPAAFGEFKGDRRFYRVCRACNGHIGIAEQHMLQCAPEGLLRDLVRPTIKSGRRKRGRRKVGSSGMPPPSVRTSMGGEWWDVHQADLKNRIVHPVDEIIVTRLDGSTANVRLYAGMSAQDLKERVEREAPGGFKSIRVSYDEQHTAAFQTLFEKAWPGHIYEQLPATPAGCREVTCRHEFLFTDLRYRAIAKILFHYFLVYGSRGYQGDEPEFAPIRDFIMNGGDLAPFFDVREVSFDTGCRSLGDGRSLAPARWSHYLAIDESLERSRRIVGFVQLFVGPESTNDGFRIALGALNPRIVLPGAQFGHCYRYFEEQPASGFAGEAERISLLIQGAG